MESSLNKNGMDYRCGWIMLEGFREYLLMIIPFCINKEVCLLVVFKVYQVKVFAIITHIRGQ